MGGRPVFDSTVDESGWPVVDDSDLAAVEATLRSGRISWINDTETPALEREWASRVGVAHCVALGSGTAALHAAVAAVGVGPGDEVLVPALSFLASATAVLHHQGIPVFVDVDPVTFTLDPARLEAALTGRTRAIVPVHLHGLPADMAPILDFARRHGLAVIEDAAQAHDATYRGRIVGGLGDVGAFSIMAGKNFATAGEGGLLTTDDVALRDRADSVKMFGERLSGSGERTYHAETMGWNYRLSAVLSAFARSQLRRLDRYTAEVREGAQRLTKTLDGVPGVAAPHVPADRTHVYHHFRVTVRPEEVGSPLAAGPFRQAVQDALAAEGVPVGSYQTRPLPDQPLFRRGIGYGRGCPWTCGHAASPQTSGPDRYRGEDFPATLDVIRSTFVVGHRLCLASLRDPGIVDRYGEAFAKVLGNLDELHAYAAGRPYAEPWEGEESLW
jgi:dTDP-4-amino-4,6-dideoxygalactose transaminase